MKPKVSNRFFLAAPQAEQSSFCHATDTTGHEKYEGQSTSHCSFHEKKTSISHHGTSPGTWRKETDFHPLDNYINDFSINWASSNSLHQSFDQKSPFQQTDDHVNTQKNFVSKQATITSYNKNKNSEQRDSQQLSDPWPTAVSCSFSSAPFSPRPETILIEYNTGNMRLNSKQ